MSTGTSKVYQNYDKSFRPIFDGTKDPYGAEDESSLPLNLRNRSKSAPPRLRSLRASRRNRGRASRRGRGRASRRGRGRASRRGRGRASRRGRGRR